MHLNKTLCLNNILLPCFVHVVAIDLLNTTRKWTIPDGQKPSGITGLPTGMKFPTANCPECADRTSSSGKTTFPNGWPTGKFSWRELLTVYGRAGLVEYLTATRHELWFWPSGNQLWAVKKITRAELHTSNSVCMLVPYTCPSYTYIRLSSSKLLD